MPGEAKATAGWRWTENAGGGAIAPDERLPWGQTIVAGLQHAIVMFGAIGLDHLLGWRRGA